MQISQYYIRIPSLHPPKNSEGENKKSKPKAPNKANQTTPWFHAEKCAATDQYRCMST